MGGKEPKRRINGNVYSVQKTYPTEPDLPQETVENDPFTEAGIIPLEVLAGPVREIEDSGKVHKLLDSKHTDDEMTGGNFNTFGE